MGFDMDFSKLGVGGGSKVPKVNVILLNKADLVPESVREEWAHYWSAQVRTSHPIFRLVFAESLSWHAMSCSDSARCGKNQGVHFFFFSAIQVRDRQTWKLSPRNALSVHEALTRVPTC